MPSRPAANITPQLFPGDSGLFLGAWFADVFHQGDLSGFIHGLTFADLAVMSEHIVQCEFIMLPEQPSWWMETVLPAIDSELSRRCRPKPTYMGGGPLAKLKALDLAVVAGRYTQLHRAGPGKLKGRCPLRDEREPPFYVYEQTRRWRCFGGCASGGDVVDLLRELKANHG